MPYLETKKMNFGSSSVIPVIAALDFTNGTVVSQTSSWAHKEANLTTKSVPQKANKAILSFIVTGTDTQTAALSLFGYYKKGAASLMMTTTVLRGLEKAVNYSGATAFYADESSTFVTTLWLEAPTKSENTGISRVLMTIPLLGVSELIVVQTGGTGVLTAVEVTFI